MAFKNINERIQNMTEKEVLTLYKPERYQSNFKLMARHDLKRHRQPNRTMGKAQETLPDPKKYLKKNSRNVIRSTNTDPRCLLTDRRPEIPKPMLKSEELKQSKTKDFLGENIRRAIKSAPPQSSRKYVDTYRGTIQPSKNSGLEPFYVYKKGFGKVPKFSHCHRMQNKLHDDEHETKDGSSSSDHEHKMHTALSEEERNGLLHGLKTSLTEKNKDFLLLPVIIDTPYLINHKRKIEREIAQIEKDIKNIELHAVIYLSH